MEKCHPASDSSALLQGEAHGVMKADAEHLSDAAALLMAVLVEGEHALLAYQIHCLLGVWECVLDADTIMLLHCVKEAVCLRIESASVQAAQVIHQPVKGGLTIC